MLGHSTVALTLDTYSHTLPNLQADAAARMQAILAEKPPQMDTADDPQLPERGATSP
jgi:hypothetical protein